MSMHIIFNAIVAACPQSSHFWRLFKYILCIFTLGYVAFFLVYQLPQEPLREHVLQAYEQNFFAENHPRRSPEMTRGKRFDMWTECAGIGNALTDGHSLVSLFEMRYYGNCEGLSAAAAKKFSQPPTQSYARYIHGYLLMLKPLYTFFTIQQVRFLVSCMTIMLIAGLFYALMRQVDMPRAVIVLTAFFLPNSPNIYWMASHAAQLYIILVSAITILFVWKKTSPFLFLGIVGTLDGFCTFLNMGSLSLSLPLLCYTLVAWRNDMRADAILSQAFWGCVGWSIGFVLPWLLKWALVFIIINPDSSVFFEGKIDEYAPHSLAMIAQALFNNITTTRWEVWVPLFSCIAWQRWRIKATMPANLWVVLLPALLPIIWVCFLPGQSGIKHSTFINFIFWPFLAAVLLYLLPMPKGADFWSELKQTWLRLPQSHTSIPPMATHTDTPAKH